MGSRSWPIRSRQRTVTVKPTGVSRSGVRSCDAGPRRCSVGDGRASKRRAEGRAAGRARGLARALQQPGAARPHGRDRPVGEGLSLRGRLARQPAGARRGPGRSPAKRRLGSSTGGAGMQGSRESRGGGVGEVETVVGVAKWRNGGMAEWGNGGGGGRRGKIQKLGG